MDKRTRANGNGGFRAWMTRRIPGKKLLMKVLGWILIYANIRLMKCESY
jgi:hypothetical protein